MILLKIAKEIPEQIATLERIQSMSLAHKVEYIKPSDPPEMVAYGEIYKGIKSINECIYELEDFVDAWYECRCDKFE